MKHLTRLLACAFALSLLASCKGAPPKEQAASMYEGELKLTAPALEGFIKVYCATRSKGTDGLVVHDAEKNQDLLMKLGTVRAVDPAPETSPGHYYITAEMMDQQGASYDVDFLYKKTERGIEVSEVLIHKAPDRTRYEWVKDDKGRFWVRQPMS